MCSRRRTEIFRKRNLNAAIDAKTILVSVMAVNNETGVLLPLKDIAGMIKRKKAPALFHTDAVQGFCKIPLQPKKLGVDLTVFRATRCMRRRAWVRCT